MVHGYDLGNARDTVGKNSNDDLSIGLNNKCNIRDVPDEKKCKMHSKKVDKMLESEVDDKKSDMQHHNFCN